MTRPRDYSNGVTLSGMLAVLLKTTANRFVLVSALSSNGALRKTLAVPGLRLASRFFAWWSRGWVGQVLGFGWSVATFTSAFRNQRNPAQIGDEWAAFQYGNVKPAIHSTKKRGTH